MKKASDIISKINPFSKKESDEEDESSGEATGGVIVFSGEIIFLTPPPPPQPMHPRLNPLFSLYLSIPHSHRRSSLVDV